MAKKKGKLPAGFREIVKSGDFDAFKKVYDECAIDAVYVRTENYFKPTENALFIPEISGEMVRWLVANGLDINSRSSEQRTPLQVAAYAGNNLKLFLELGADVNAASEYGVTPLFEAAFGHHIENIKVLLENGADFNLKTNSGMTPLHGALSQCRNDQGFEDMQIPSGVEVAKIFLNAGQKITKILQYQIVRIANELEEIRDGTDKELLAKMDAGMQELYKLFKVPPIVFEHVDVLSVPIEVTSKKWEDAHGELWKKLVPASGKAKTLQGEIIRATGRLFMEINENGGVNWCKDFKLMAQAVPQYLREGNSLDNGDLETADGIVKEIDGFSDEEQAAKLCELAVKWVRQNSQLIAFNATSAKYKR